MKRKVTKTSKEALKKNKKTFLSRQAKLQNFMINGKIGSALDFAKLLKIPRNECAKRLSDLYRLGLTQKLGRKTCPVSKTRVTVYGYQDWIG